MTSIRGCRCPHKKRISEGPSGSLSFPESSLDKTLVNPPTIEPPVAKYTEEDLQKILRTILEARASPSDDSREKPLKARLFDVYRNKSHMECYNFC